MLTEVDCTDLSDIKIHNCADRLYTQTSWDLKLILITHVIHTCTASEMIVEMDDTNL